MSDILEYIQTIVKRPKWALLCIMCITVIVYLPTFENLLQTGWDDQWQVNNRYTENGLSWQNIKAIFTEPIRFQYSPVDQLMYTIIYQLKGYSPKAFHGANLILHLTNIVLLYYLIRHTLKNASKLNSGMICWISFLVCMVFSIHPVQVESVAWVSASKIPLYSCFYILGLIFWAKYLQTPKTWILLIVFTCFSISYGSKEQAVVFPLMAFLYCIIYHKDIKQANTYIPLLGLFIMAAILGILCISVISSFSITPPGSNNDYLWWQRITFGIYSIVEYIMKWLAPYNLMHLYRFPMQPSEPMPSWLLVYPILFSISFITLGQHIKHPTTKIGILVFLINIILVLHIFPIRRPNIVADRYMYLSGIGLTLIVVHFIVYNFPKWSKRIQSNIILGGSIYLLWMGIYSSHRIKQWKNTTTLKKELIDAQKNG